MIRSRLRLVIPAAALAAALLVGSARGQAPVASEAAPAAGSPGDTVSPVTVMPSPKKPCAPKDKDCIGLVIAELKQHYPDQLKIFCFQQNMTVLRRDMQANIAGWCTGPGQGASAICSHYVPPAVKQACASDPKK